MKTIGEIIADRKFSVRKFRQFKFEDKKKCKNMFISTFMEVDKTFEKFEWLPEYDQIIEWLNDNKRKGLALIGSVGMGKTSIMAYVIPVLFEVCHKKIILVKLATELKMEEITNGQGWVIAIDDIGMENIKNDYGTKTDIVAEAINNAEYYSKMLLLTSNLTEEELIERYGLRTFDRIRRLCKIVVFKGKSLRQ